MRAHFFVAVGLLTFACGGGATSPSQPSITAPSPPASSTAAPPPASSPVTLTGFVRETAPTDTVQVANARVEVIEPGPFLGQFAVTDANGAYQFPGLSGSLSFRASKAGYEGDPRRFHLAQTKSGDFNIMPVSRKSAREPIAIGQSRAGVVSGTDSTCGGMYFRLACKRFALAFTAGQTARARLTWPSRHDLDLELWGDDTLMTASLTCQSCGLGTSEETITMSVSPGQYELRVIYFWDNDGSPASFDLRVSRPE